tara:strand:- start:663 stop:836 length:174 start_codon:yes stop_codon:yes gene_type:complete
MAKQVSKWTLTERITPNSIHCDRSDTDAKWLTSQKKPRWILTKRITPNLNHASNYDF